MKKVLTFMVALTMCALAFPSLFVAYSQDKGRLSATKFHRVGKAIAGQYIAVFKKDSDPLSTIAIAKSLTLKHGGKIKHIYEHALKGFALQASEASALALSRDPQGSPVTGWSMRNEGLRVIEGRFRFLSSGVSNKTTKFKNLNAFVV